MKTSRILTLLAVFILSMVLVTAVLAAANSTRQSTAMAEKNLEAVQISELTIPEAESAAPASAAQEDAVNTVISESPKAGYKYGPPPDPAFEKISGDVSFDPTFTFGPGGAYFAAQGSGMQPLSMPPLPRDENIVIDMDSERVWGVPSAGEPFTVSVNGTQMGAGSVDNTGFFWTTLYDSNGDRPGLHWGDEVKVYLDGAPQVTVTLPQISGYIDSNKDLVLGQLRETTLTDLTVYASYRNLTSYWVTTTVDASGYFTADFSTVFDLKAWANAYVAAVDDGVEIHKEVFSFEPSLLVQPMHLNTALGSAEEGSSVTVTLFNDGGGVVVSDVLTTNENHHWEWRPEVDFEEDYVVQAEISHGGPVLTRTIDKLTINYDPANDRITGETISNTVVRGQTNIVTADGWKEVEATTTADSSGYYTVQYSADLSPRMWAGVFVADDEGDDLNLWTHDTFLNVNQTDNNIWGWGPSPPGESEGRQVTITLASTDTQYVTTMNWAGRFELHQDDPGIPDINPGEMVTVEVEGYSWQTVVPVNPMTATPDVDNDWITGEVTKPTGKIEVLGSQWGWEWIPPLYPIAGDFEISTTAHSPYTATPPGFDIRNAVNYEVRHYVSDDGAEAVSGNVDYLRVWPLYNAICGSFSPPETAYTITLKEGGGATKAELTGTADDFIDDCIDFWDTGEFIEVGDKVEVQADNGFGQVIYIPAFDIQYDLANDKITGNVLSNVLLYVEVGDQGEGFVPTDANGDFAITVDQFQNTNGDGDLVWGQSARVCYATNEGNHICADKGWPDITARYSNMGWNDVFGNNAIPDNQILITVTNDVGAYVNSGETVAGKCDWCGPTEYQLDFGDGEIISGNRVTVDFGDGFIDYVDVVSITVEPDVGTGFFTVTVPPSSTINVNVNNRWGDHVDNWDEIEVDGSGIYSFDMSGRGIEPGDEFHVYVPGNHNHQTEYIHGIPYTELSIQKRTENGHPMPGFPYIYQIEYWNDSQWEAENVVITDALPLSTTYAGDTGGFSVEDGGDVITWTVGSVDPWSYARFYVAVDVGSSVPLDYDLPENCAWIISTTPGDEMGDNNHCSDTRWVEEGQTGLGVNKYAEPGDPHPGQTFQYVIDYYSNGGVATGPAWLTDTLPAGTSVEGWYDENGWEDLWTDEFSTDEKFVLYAPAGVPGDMGGRIRLTLFLTDTANFDDYLTNHVIITTTNKVDDNPDDNEWLNEDAQVSGERHDLYIEKSINSQVPIPGGRIDYFIEFYNQGNVETNVTLTDTLDEYLTYESAHWGGNQPFQDDPFPEPTVDDQQLVWDLGSLAPAESKWFHIQVAISDTQDPGEEVTNCITIGGEYDESTTGDNTSCVDVTLNPPGPNLKVTKSSEFRDNNEILRYWVHFENIGDEEINNVWLTDTLPISTSLDGDWWMDFDDSRQVTPTLDGRVFNWEFERLDPGDSGWLNVRVRLDDHNDRPKWYTNTAEITIPTDDIYEADNASQVVDVLGEIQSVDLIVNRDHSNMWGESQPGRAVTVTTAVSTTYAYWNGDCDGCWNVDDIGPIWPGDVVTVTSGDGVLPVIFEIPNPFEALADSENNQVTGQIDSLNDETIDMNVHGGPDTSTQTDSSGHFTGSLDIPRGAQGEVRYSTMDDFANVTYHSNWTMMDLIIRVNYGHDWISGNYEEGYTVWLTVTESTSTNVKGTAQLETGYPQDWDQPGFSTNEDDWDGGQAPDILPGDWVFGYVEPTGGGMAPLNGGSGYSTEVQVGTIEGNVDVDSDTITGTVNAAWWLTDTVDIDCHPWGSDGGVDNKQFNGLDPDGVDVYNCSWAGEWDLQPGHDVAVEYYEPDGDSVMNVFYEPTAYLQIEKWAEGNPGVGGNFTFYVRYRNNGESDAENVVITDTLSTGMTYITDTLEVPSTGTGPVIWDVGTVSPGEEFQFEVYVDVTGSSGEWITNTVQIATSSYDQGEPEEKTTQTSREILDNSAKVNIGKEPWTGDPAPGEKFIWRLNACNNEGDTGSSTVTLTDTIPISTTLVDVWLGGNGWTEIAWTTDEYVLTRPTLDSYRCEDVYLVFEVDALAQPGQMISNTAVISASHYTDPENNEANSEVWVHDPHTNLSTDKWWNWGQLVPGGEASYSIEARNNGNTGVSNIIMTDTLPVDSSIVGLWKYDLNWNNGFEIAYTTAGRDVIWDVGSLIPGEYKNYEIQIQFDSEIEVGTVITNSVVIEHQPDEDQYDDNYAERVDEIFDHGPNLRVFKSGEWEDYGSDIPRGAYHIQVENVGDEAIGPVVISDTYPAELPLDTDSLWSSYQDSGRNYEWTDHPGENYFTVTLQELSPGEGSDIWFLLAADTLDTGLTLTNTARVMTDDGTPDDNEDSSVLTTGPDLWVEKEWIGGSAEAGEEIDFELRFGNDIPGHHWWWNIDGDTWLTDTLPDELTFITATVQCDQGECGIMPNINGNELGWEFGQMNSGEQQVIYLTVKITDTVGPAETFTNTAVVSAEQPGDNGEVDTDNNTAAAAVTMPCTPITDVNFTVSPDFILVGETVTFSLTITPSNASVPITATWDMGDGGGVITNGSDAHYMYNEESGYMVVGVDVENACSFVSADDKTIWVASDQIFLPLILR